ncbi:MAG: exodeoxyribonuclease VII small subunit [Dysgonamonadaceae bacterium]|jgi:exodeoxyribonuclease VII small subunit|nr:exodeoxyribonuclease VII small subunit [Dysgonamonadaceae bacterium]
MAKQEISYTQAYNRLQEIQQLMENNQLDVDKLNSMLKEASVLLNICKNKLFVISEEAQKILNDLQ